MRSYRHQILQWKNTTERYVAVIQSPERFAPNSFREIRRGPDETWIVGRLAGTEREDLYAIGLRRVAMDYSEARERARAAVERVDALLQEGKDPFRA